MRHSISLVLVVAVVCVGRAVYAAAPRDFLATFDTAARAADPSFAPVPARGATFFRSRHGSDWSCASCHTDHPAAVGRHAATGKVIQPLAPAVNVDRLTDPAKVDKWFRRNCGDVLGRECTSREKADVVAWLLTIR